MTTVTRFWPILTATHRYDKSISTRNRGHGQMIEAPILAYLIETKNGRSLYDVGCDYNKIADPERCDHYYNNSDFEFGPPRMSEEQRLPNRLQQLGLTPLDVDLVFIGHLHFDHAGGLCDFCHADIHVHEKELIAARQPADGAYFRADFEGDYRWRLQTGEYDLCPGVRAIATPGHTAGLVENIQEEIAPGLCWQDREDQALESLRYLKRLAQSCEADIWPNHDMDFYRRHACFPRGMD